MAKHFGVEQKGAVPKRVEARMPDVELSSS
jgi:hypothetical protein